MIVAGMLAALPAASVFAQDTPDTCAVYFTGIGCSHCARTDPSVLDKLPKSTRLVVVEYEIYRDAENSRLMTKYNDVYGQGLGIPQIIFDKDRHTIGDRPILQGITGMIAGGSNPCPMIDGSSVTFEDMNITALPGMPKIWKDEKILMFSGGGGDAKLLKGLLVSDDVLSLLDGAKYDVIKPVAVPLSGGDIYFDNAVRLEGWIFQWNGEGFDDFVVNDSKSQDLSTRIMIALVDTVNAVRVGAVRLGGWIFQWNGEELDDSVIVVNDSGSDVGANQESPDRDLKLSTLTMIALADTVNPCALAVFILMLVGITTYDVGNKKRQVLKAGLSFVTAVYIMYFFYGLIIIRSFQLVDTITNVRPFLYTTLGWVSVVLGLLHLRGVLWYKPGGFMTEMPMSWRPRVKKLMTSITSPKGAFFMGAFVTLFLIPCTMGPYFIAGGMLSVLELAETVPWLLIYDLVFIVPLIMITFAIHYRFKKVDDVSGWKEKNIKNLHFFIAGLMLFIGFGILSGWI